MNLIKKIFFILIFIFLSVNFLKAEEKVSYIDIDYLLTNTIAGKELLKKLKNEEELKIDKFKSNDETFRDEQKKILAKKNLISKEEINKEMKSLQSGITGFLNLAFSTPIRKTSLFSYVDLSMPWAVKAAAVWPNASTIRTPGITGWPGKWPWTKKLSFFTLTMPVADVSFLISWSSSISNIGSLCGNKFSISFLFKFVIYLISTVLIWLLISSIKLFVMS